MAPKEAKAPEPQDSSSYDTWGEARRIAALVGNVSSIFSTCIRFLRKDADNKAKTLSSTSKFCLQRLLNSPSFKAPVYYAALTFKREQLQQQTYLTPTGLAALFAPDELAHIIGILYLYRRIQKGCDEDDWAELSKTMHLHAEIAGHLGQSIPNIGLAWGLLLGSIRHLSSGLFLGLDKKKYGVYRRNQKMQKRTFNLEEEMQNFGCTHIHLASLLTQSLGLGSSIPKAMNSGLLLTKIADSDLDDEAYRVRIAWEWIEALKATGKAPNITHRGAYYPLKDALENLYTLVNEVRPIGSKYSFFARGKDDISPEKTPLLFPANTKVAKAEDTPPPESVDKEVVEQFEKAPKEVEEL